MRQQFSMYLRLAAAIVAAAWLMVGPASAQTPSTAPLQLADDAPSTYTVVKGDTLWAISGRFLKDPWRWPELWGWNKAQIKDPHWIYPGDVLVLDRNAAGGPRLSVAGGSGGTVRLSPGVRTESLAAQAIPAIPVGDLEPYLTKSIITPGAGLPGSGEIVAGRDRERITRAAGDRIYAVGVAPSGGETWYIFRPGKALVAYDPPHNILGFENRFIGVARAERFGEVSTLTIQQSNEEVFVGDRLIPVPPETLLNYVPHAPPQPVSGHIIASYANASEMGRGNLVVIDRGTHDGVDVGAVLAIYQGGRTVVDPRPTPIRRSCCASWTRPRTSRRSRTWTCRRNASA